MIINYKKNSDKCIILTQNNNEYKKISDIPESEYSYVHTIKNINCNFIKKKNEFYKISKFINLRFILCDIDNWEKSVKEEIINEIAFFEKLSNVSIIDYCTYSLIPHNNGTFIWENKMTIFNPTNIILMGIPDSIIYLNIINNNEYDYVNIPSTVKHLHICINKIEDYKQTNLSVELQSITITIPELCKRYPRDYLYTVVKSKTKLPFGCKLIIDDIFE